MKNLFWEYLGDDKATVRSVTVRLRNRFSLQLQNFHFSTVLCVLSSFSVTISHICFKMTWILFAALLLRPLITCNCDHTCVAPVCSPVSHQRPLYFSPRAATARARLMCVYRLRHTFCANTRAKFWGWLFGYFLLVILGLEVRHLSSHWEESLLRVNVLLWEKCNQFDPDTGTRTLPRLGGLKHHWYELMCHRLN